MDGSAIAGRLSELGIELPPPPAAIAAYVPCVVRGDLAFVSGQVPMRDGSLMHAGHLGDQVTVEDGAEAAAQTALQALSALREAAHGFERVERLLQVRVFVASTPDFVDHPKVANGASDMLLQILGEEGRHARAAIGVASLPLGACVELTLTAALTP